MVLYLNNYKGFTDTFIPLKQVNFLVGENSTGKSTVLGVLEMLSKISFWTAPQLSSSEFGLGPFGEIVNQCSSDRTFFQIGAEFESFNTIGQTIETITMRFLETFKEHEGKIILDSVRFSVDNLTIFCDGINNPTIFVSKSRKNYKNFTDWVHALPPSRKKEVVSTQYIALYIPSLVRLAQEQLNINDMPYSIIFPMELSNLMAFSPIRAEAHRIYETFQQSFSPQGDHIPVLLNNLIRSNNKGNKAIIQRLVEFGKDSQLFDSISTQGFGNAADSPFTVSVSYDNVRLNLTNVGYGVSQSLPLAVEILQSASQAFSIQQPEVHLHPKAQAAFGDLMYESAALYNKSFFCETHSDFVINRFRYSMNKGRKKPKSQVLFFTRDAYGTHVEQIPIDDNGHYESVPDEYMRFFIDEELRMLEF